MRKFIPDDVSLGAQLFFLAQTQIHAKQPQDAHRSLVECASTHWADKKHNAYILHFSLAKLLQSQGMHEDAIGAFNKAIDMYPNNSHTFFRRAWSYKVCIDLLTNVYFLSTDVPPLLFYRHSATSLLRGMTLRLPRR